LTHPSSDYRLDPNPPSNRCREDNLLDPCLQMVQIRGTMDVFEELPDNYGRHQAPPPPSPQALVALDQLLATQNALMQRLVANEESREAHELLQQ
jgi:hypothetical protein